jgi:AcrR family transcriptional regulator
MRKNLKAEIRKPQILENYYAVLIEEGIEGVSIGKIAKRMGIHPSLIIHYFQTKENLTLELVDYLIEKYEAPEYLQFDQIEDPQQRFEALLDTIFSKAWSRTVDPGTHFGFYYLSFRNPKIRQRFEQMIQKFRDYLLAELERFQAQGVVTIQDARQAADMMVTLMEGLEFHAHFLAGSQRFDLFAHTTRESVKSLLTRSPPVM